MDKSPDAFRTISEVAEDLDVPQHVLRFWETRFPQIRPLKRGGGRRYYRPDDVLLIQGIRRLLYGEGYTIKGVQRILKEQGIRQVQAIGRGAPLTAMPDMSTSETARAEMAVSQDNGDLALPDDLSTEHLEDADDEGAGYALSEASIAVLEAVYAELGACRRVLGAALAEPQSVEDLP